jgi:tetratricopeptide (TPR) repeat protein
MSRIALFEEFLRQKPGDRFAMYSLALELKKSGDIEASERAFRELLARHPSSGAGHYQHGLLLAEAGRIPEARAAWQAGLEALGPLDEAEARRSIGEIQRALDELD